jgi:hypothetical protein
VEAEDVNSPGFIKKCHNATWFLETKEMVIISSKKEMVVKHEKKK